MLDDVLADDAGPSTVSRLSFERARF